MGLIQYGTPLDFPGGPILLQSLGSGSVAVFDNAATGDGRLYVDNNGALSQIGSTAFNPSGFNRLADGAYLLTRQQYPQQDLGGSHFEVLNADGSVRVGDTDVADDSGRAIGGPAATPTPDGGFFVGFTDEGNANASDPVSFSVPSNGFSSNDPGEAADAGYRFYAPSGGGYTGGPLGIANIGSFDLTQFGNEATGSNTAGQQTAGGVATLANGTVVEAYLSNVQYPQKGGGLSPANAVAVRLVSTAGVSGPIQVSQDPPPPDNSGLYAPAFAERGDGGIQVVAVPTGFAVFWTARSFTPDASTYGGFAANGYDTNVRYFDQNGNAQTNTLTVLHRAETFGGASLAVAADSLGDGRIALAYADGTGGDNGNSDSQLSVAVLGVLGSSEAAAPITPGPVNGVTQSNVQLASLGNGNIAVGYTQNVGNVDPGDAAFQAGTVLQTFNVDGVVPPPSVSFDPTTAGFANGVTPVITGTVSGTGATGVELYQGDPANGGQDLGAATINGDGTWTFQNNLGAGDFNTLTALATDASGLTAQAAAPYELVTGTAGVPYRAVEYDYTADGSYGYTDYARNGTPLVDALDNGDGTHTIFALADKQTLSSIGNDTITGGGQRETFSFASGFGHDEITDFGVGGSAHDTLDLGATQIRSLAQALRHTTMADGNATIHLGHGDAITLDGVTKAQLAHNPHDITLG